ncbi:MAG TPA: hypothetical protein VMO88_18045 [Acidimicrobiales bacterium]|nr:hypothetical protein [Acidimicrobiales bacterium]
MTMIEPKDQTVIDDMITVLANFLRATDALTGAINGRDAVAMCDALEGLGKARERALALVGRQPAAI